MMTERSQELLAEVRSNLAKLNSCPVHHFEPDGPKRVLLQRYRCTECGGTVDAHAFRWYSLGKAHGRHLDQLAAQTP